MIDSLLGDLTGELTTSLIEFNIDNWILATGFWRDSGIWEDDKIWID